MQFMSSYCRLCYLVATHTILFTAYILLFSSYIILFQASASSYSHSIHHPINNSYHLIYNWYHNLFANIIPPYLHLYHAILIICPILLFAYLLILLFVLFLEICLYKIVIATWNSHGILTINKRLIKSCPLTNNVTITPYIQNQNHFIWDYFMFFLRLHPGNWKLTETLDRTESEMTDGSAHVSGSLTFWYWTFLLSSCVIGWFECFGEAKGWIYTG